MQNRALIDVDYLTKKKITHQKTAVTSEMDLTQSSHFPMIEDVWADLRISGAKNAKVFIEHRQFGENWSRVPRLKQPMIFSGKSGKSKSTFKFPPEIKRFVRSIAVLPKRQSNSGKLSMSLFF